MSTVAFTAESLPLVVPYHPARLSVEDYHRLINTLEDKRPIELLKGVIVEKMTHNPLHAALIGILQSLLNAIVPASFHTRSQVPITLHHSEPEPDLAVIRGKHLDYVTRHPGPTETLLVIEISSTSLLTDRFKAEIYAEAGIPWYWIVNLTARRVEVYSQPELTASGLRYSSPQIYQPGDALPVILAGQQIGTLSATDLLPEIVTP